MVILVVGTSIHRQRGACDDFVNLKTCRPSLLEVLVGVSVRICGCLHLYCVFFKKTSNYF